MQNCVSMILSNNFILFISNETFLIYVAAILFVVVNGIMWSHLSCPYSQSELGMQYKVLSVVLGV